MEMQFFETCTRYLVQNGIPKPTKRCLDPLFWSGADQDEPGRPARPAWPPVPAGGPGRPAGLAGSPWASWLRSPVAQAGSGFGQRSRGRRQGRQQLRPPLLSPQVGYLVHVVIHFPGGETRCKMVGKRIPAFLPR